MSFRSTVLLVIAFLTLALISDADAFDGNRKGFILGGGLGLGVTSFTQTVGGFGPRLTLERGRKLGLQTSFRIGYAPSEYGQIYWSNRVSWFGMENNFGNHVAIAHGIGGIGVTYYFHPVTPSFFITGVIGFSTWFTLFESYPDILYGDGISGGFGYEFVRHWSVEISVSHGDLRENASGRRTSFSALTVKAFVSVVEY